MNAAISAIVLERIRARDARDIRGNLAPLRPQALAASAGVMYGPPYDQPLPIVRSIRSPSSRARRDVNAMRSRNSADRYG